MAAGGYVTTTRRRLLSLLVGAGTGGFLAFVGCLFIPDARASLLANEFVILVFVTIAIWILLSLVFLVPIIPVALLWAWAERRRALGWKAAVAWGGLPGALCSATPFLILLVNSLRRYAATPSFSLTGVSIPSSLIIFTVACPVVGCLVALATWRFAYRRQPAAVVGEIFS